MKQRDVRKEKERKRNGNKKHTKGKGGIRNGTTIKYPLNLI